MSIGLPHFYRFKLKNEIGSNIPTGKATIKCRRMKFDTSGTLTFEAAEATLLDTTGAVLTNASFVAGTSVHNSAASTFWLGGQFTFIVDMSGASGGMSGNVNVYLERSSDSGVTWDSDGLGDIVATINFVTATAWTKTFVI